MKYKILPTLVVPALLIFTGIFGHLTLKNHWNYEIASYFIFLFTLVYILIFERLIPLKQEWHYNKKTLFTDLKHFIFSAALFDALGKMFVLSLAIHIQNNYFDSFNFWNSFPLFITYIIANLIGEFLPYVYHRISHKGDSNSFTSLFLWKTHSIHHLPTKMNWFKTNWIHPINMFLNTVLKILPLLLLGFSDAIIFLVGITHVVVAYISHANIQTSKSFWDYIIVTPQVHHFHHSKKIDEAKNFGNIIPFWDLLLGTYYNRQGVVNQVGVIENSKTHYPQKTAYLRQLLFPLTISKDCCNKLE